MTNFSQFAGGQMPPDWFSRVVTHRQNLGRVKILVSVVFFLNYYLFLI